MARTRKKYGTRTRQPGLIHRTRGGVKGKCVDSGFGSATNHNRAKKNYKTRRETES